MGRSYNAGMDNAFPPALREELDAMRAKLDRLAGE